MAQHTKFSTFRAKPQVEFHDDATCNPATASQFSRFTFGSAKAAKIARAIIANGVNDVAARIALVAGPALSADERAKLEKILTPSAQTLSEFTSAKPATEAA